MIWAARQPMEKLMGSAQKLFQKVYEQTQAATGAQGNPNAGAGPQGGYQSNPSDDGVVDGDFREI